jgi:hypothetical protein
MEKNDEAETNVWEESAKAGNADSAATLKLSLAKEKGDWRSEYNVREIQGAQGTLRLRVFSFIPPIETVPRSAQVRMSHVPRETWSSLIVHLLVRHCRAVFIALGKEHAEKIVLLNI